MKTDPRRFCRLYALSLAPIALLLALLTCWQISVMHVVGTLNDSRLIRDQLAAGWGLASVLRSVAPAATGSALLLALVAWARPLAEGTFRLELGWVLRRGAVVTLVGYPVASALGAISGAALGPWLFDLPANLFTPTGEALRALGWGMLAAGIDSALVSFVAWRFLGVLRGLRLSMAGSLIAACTAVFPLRAVVGLVLESMLPG